MKKFFAKIKTFITNNRVISVLLALVLIGAIACAIALPIILDRPEHVHGYASEWTKNEEYHWHASTCGHNGKDKAKHEFEESVEPAACLTDGKKVLICKVCGFEKGEEVLPALAHKYVSVGYTAATCVKGEVETYKCELCGDTYEVETGKPLGHELSEDPSDGKLVLAEGETCKFAIAYECSRCREEVAVGELVEKHDYVATVKTAATCKIDGEKLYKCMACGDEKIEKIPVIPNAHKWTETSRVESKITYTCDACRETKIVIDASKETKATVTPEDVKTAEINVNNAVIKLDETTAGLLTGESEITLKAGVLTDDETAGLNLSEEQRKQIGGKIYNFEIVKGSGDNLTEFGGGKVTVTLEYELSEGEDVDNIAVWYLGDGEPTAISATYYEVDGKGYVTFETGHFSRYTVTRLSKKERCALYGHNIQTEMTKVTCISDGYTVTLCVRCGEIVSKETVKSEGHKFVETRVEPTCTNDGSVVKKCSVCGKEISEYLPRLGHKYENGVCTVCGEGCEHKLEVKRTVAPTCTEDGYTEYECVKCGFTKTDDIVKAEGHKFKNGECEVCHEKAVSEEKYYLNMVKTFDEKGKFAVKLTDVVLDGESFSKLIKNNVEIFKLKDGGGYIKQVEATEIVLALGDDGKLIGTATGAIEMVTYGNLTNYKNISFKAAIQNGYVYVYADYEEYDDMNTEDRQKGYLKISFGDLLVAIDEDLDEPIMQTLEIIEKVFGEIPADIMNAGDRIAVKAQKLILDMLFDKVSAENGNKYVLTFEKLGNYVEKLKTLKASEIIDYFFGDNAYDALAKFVPAVLELPLDGALEKLSDLGIDYKEILLFCDKVAKEITGEDNYVTDSVNKAIKDSNGAKLKEIIAKATNAEVDKVAATINDVVKKAGESSLVDLIFETYGETIPITKDKLFETIGKGLKTIKDSAKGLEVSFSADMYGFITSIDVNFDDFYIPQFKNNSSGGINDDNDGVTCDYEYTYRLNGKVQIVADENPVVTDDYQRVINDIESKKLKFEPNSTIEVSVYEGVMTIETDETGEVKKITIKAMDFSLGMMMYKTADFIFDKDSVICLDDGSYCGTVVSFNVWGKTITKLQNGGEIEGYNSFTLLYDYVNNKTVDEQSAAHHFVTDKEKSDLRCGGKIVEVCADCGDIRTGTIIHNGERVVKYQAINGVDYCYDGVLASYYCSECKALLGKAIKRNYFDDGNHCYNDEDKVEYFLKDYGGVCDTKLIVYTCVCGHEKYVEVEGECDFDGQYGGYCDFAYITEDQLQVDGYFYPSDWRYEETIVGIEFCSNSGYTFKCSVTDPKACKAEFTAGLYWRKADNCTAELHYIVNIKNGDEYVTVLDDIVATHVYHDYELTESERDETGKSWEKATCKDCGSYVYSSYRYYTDENERKITVREDIRVNNLNDGRDKSYSEIERTVDGEDNYYSYTRTITRTDADGKETVTERKTTPCDVSAPFERGYCEETIEGGYSYKTTYGYYKGYEYIIDSRTTYSDGRWSKYEYEYDFSCCLRTEKYTNSDGKNRESADYAHYYRWNIVKDPTCTQPGVYEDTCAICGDEKYDSIEPNGHNWDPCGHDLFICYACGLVNSNGASGKIVMEDLTDYVNGEDYVVGYYNRGDVGFTPYITLVRKTTEGDANDIIKLDIASDKFVFTEEGVVSVKISKAVVKEAANAKLAELGLDLNDYLFRMSFVPEGEEDGDLDYAITFENALVGCKEVTESCMIINYVGADKTIDVTITPTEDIRLFVITAGNDRDVYSAIYVGDEWFDIIHGAVDAVYLEEGTTYTLRLEWNGGEYSGYMTVNFIYA